MNALADAVLLDARLDVAAARQKILRADLDRVAVRRAEGPVAFWYRLLATEGIEQLNRQHGGSSLGQALRLNERRASAAHEIGSDRSKASSDADTIVVDGSRFVGIHPIDRMHQPLVAKPSTNPRTSKAAADERESSAASTDSSGNGKGSPPVTFSLHWKPGQGTIRVGTQNSDVNKALTVTRNSAFGKLETPFRIKIRETAPPPGGRSARLAAPPARPADASGSDAFTAFPRLETPSIVAPGKPSCCTQESQRRRRQEPSADRSTSAGPPALSASTSN